MFLIQRRVGLGGPGTWLKTGSLTIPHSHACGRLRGESHHQDSPMWTAQPRPTHGHSHTFKFLPQLRGPTSCWLRLLSETPAQPICHVPLTV